MAGLIKLAAIKWGELAGHYRIARVSPKIADGLISIMAAHQAPNSAPQTLGKSLAKYKRRAHFALSSPVAPGNEAAAVRRPA